MTNRHPIPCASCGDKKWKINRGDYCAPCREKHIRKLFSPCRHVERLSGGGVSYRYVCAKRAITGGYCLEHVPVEAAVA